MKCERDKRTKGMKSSQVFKFRTVKELLTVTIIMEESFICVSTHETIYCEFRTTLYLSLSNADDIVTGRSNRSQYFQIHLNNRCYPCCPISHRITYPEYKWTSAFFHVSVVRELSAYWQLSTVRVEFSFGGESGRQNGFPVCTLN